MNISLDKRVSAVLKHLMDGGEIQIENYKVVMTTDYELATKAIREDGKTGKKTETYLPMDVTLGWFIEEIKGMTDEELFGIMANNALKKGIK